MNQEGHPGLGDHLAGPGSGATPEKDPSVLVRILVTLAVLCGAATYVASQIDFVRRHQPGIPPTRYWVPQLVQIWLPGAAATALFALCALWLHRRRRSP